jgi:hypothetical protein
LPRFKVVVIRDTAITLLPFHSRFAEALATCVAYGTQGTKRIAIAKFAVRASPTRLTLVTHTTTSVLFAGALSSVAITGLADRTIFITLARQGTIMDFKCS